jgi:hypothetical protein
VSCSRADAGQSCQLCDQVLDGRGEHGRIVPGQAGSPPESNIPARALPPQETTL